MADTTSTNISSSTSDNVGIAHNVNITYLKLTNNAGEIIDIKEIFLELNISNSIFENCIYGSVLIQDANSLLTRFPIVGEEIIEFQFNTPGNVAKTFKGNVYKVRDILPSVHGSDSSYVLEFISQEALANYGTFVAKSYRDTLTAETIITDVLKTYLNTQKTLNIDPCIDPAKVLCIPYMRPYDAIDFLRNRVKAKDSDEDYFLFFERFDGIYFKNFPSLISEFNKETTTYYTYMSNKFGDQRDQGLDSRRIISLTVNSVFDTIEKISMGMLNNEAFEYSFDDKMIYSNATSYNDVNPYIANSKLNTSGFISKYFRDDALSLSGNLTSFKERRVDQNFNFVKPAGKHIINRVTLGQVSLTIAVPGDSTVDIGDIVTINIPEFTADTDVVMDSHLTGRYIIGSIRNTFVVPDKHVMQIDLYRDGYNSNITGMNATLKALLT